MPNKEELLERSDEIIQELESSIPELRSEFQGNVESITAESERLHFDAVVVGDAESLEMYEAALEGIRVAEDKLVAVGLKEQQLNEELFELSNRIVENTIETGRKIGKKYERQISATAERFEEYLTSALKELIELRTLSTEAQDKLVNAGLSPGYMGQLSWNALKRKYSSIALQGFGRISKLNLNTSIAPSAKRWWQERL